MEARGANGLVCEAWEAPASGEPADQESNEGTMNFDLSRRGKAYLKTAETLLRNAKTMTDAAVAAQLEALADNYRQLAVKASQDDAMKAARAAQRAAAFDPYAGADMFA